MRINVNRTCVPRTRAISFQKQNQRGTHRFGHVGDVPVESSSMSGGIYFAFFKWVMLRKGYGGLYEAPTKECLKEAIDCKLLNL